MLVADAFGKPGGGGLDVDAVQHLMKQEAGDAAPHPAHNLNCRSLVVTISSNSDRN
jgi:hypothetical protein